MLTNAVRYADPAQHRIADVLDAYRLLRPINRHRVDSGETATLVHTPDTARRERR
ncbi:hypothetical protein ACFYWN_40150 [Streptomyces sp. NPDC002917]|uniref:hypothetical protein n=1 Tax=unclassified Streptomyces TaxID=2593676 RepID=UPI00368FB812|nr:hypothetical protein OG955_01095 [Streptomyces sp. NBC_01602]